jgi:hypothetical protein
MIKSIRIISLLFSVWMMPLVFWSQLPEMWIIGRDTTFRTASHWVMTNGQGLIASDALTMDWTRKMTLGGHLEKSELIDLENGMKVQNRLGAVADAGVDYYSFEDSLFGNPRIGLRITGGAQYHGAIGFSADAFHLAFLGNADKLGDTLNIDPLYYHQQAWYKIGFGLFDKQRLNSVTLSLVDGRSYRYGMLTAGSVITSPLADSIRFIYNGEFTESSRGEVGLCLDADYQIPADEQMGCFSVSLRNIGFVRWGNRTKTTTAVGDTTWTGLEWNALDSTVWNSGSFDGWRDSLGLREERKAMFAPLQGTISVRYMKWLNARLLVQGGVYIWPNRVAIPQARAQAWYTLRPLCWIGTSITYGGYSNWGVGLETQCMVKSKFYLRAGTSHLEGWINKKSKAADAWFGCGFSF